MREFLTNAGGPADDATVSYLRQRYGRAEVQSGLEDAKPHAGLRVRCRAASCKLEILARRVDRVATVDAVPVRNARRGLHLLEDLTPADARVVRA